MYQMVPQSFSVMTTLISGIRLATKEANNFGIHLVFIVLEIVSNFRVSFLSYMLSFN
jgi:hypothetical protein